MKNNECQYRWKVRCLNRRVNTVQWGVSILTLVMIHAIAACRSPADTYERIGGDHLVLENGLKKLFWFSGIHCNDPNHRMFNDIRQEFKRFKPSFVLVEGGFSRIIFATEIEAMLAGESAFTAFLARQEGVPVGDIEPNDAEVCSHLLQTYTAESVMAMFILRQMYQKQRESAQTSIDFNEYFVKHVGQYVEYGFPFESDEISPELIAELIEPYVGYNVNQSNWLDVDTYRLVYSKDGIIYHIWRETYDFRNKHAVLAIRQALETHDRVFVMMGFDHALDLVSELQDVLDTL